MLRSLAASLVAVPPLAWLLHLSGEVSVAMAVLAVAVLAHVVLLAGFLLLRAAGAADMPAPAAWGLGVAASAIAVLALVAALDLLAASAFAIWAAVVLGLSALFRERARRASRDELLALLLCGAATVFWCRGIAEVPQILSRDGVMSTWVDQFIHGATISQFGDPRAAGRQAIQLVDMPRPFYHYASYMLPAALAWPLDLPGFPLATSLWVPLGFFTLCAGAYTLGSTLGGPWGGIAALAALTLAPDAASYGLHNPAFGYHWTMLAVPGGCYAVGLCLLAIAFLHRWAGAADLRPLVAGAGLIAALPFVRAHIFLLALPAWLAGAAVHLPVVQRRKLAFAGAASAAFALFVFGYYALVPDAVPALAQFLEATERHLDQFVTVRASTLPARLLLVFPAFLGVLLVLFPVSLALAHRSRGLAAIDFVPVALLACYLLLMVSAPVPGNGDPTELTQRPFVLVYAVVAVWTAAGIAGWLARQGGLHSPRARLWLLLIGAAWLIGVLAFTVPEQRWRWAGPLAPGMPQAASFLREESRPGDVLAVQGLRAGRVYTDVAIQLVSLTGIPAYMARPFIHERRGGSARRAARERRRVLAEVAGQGDASAALARLRELGIRWYVVAGGAGPRWDPERRRAAFFEGELAVYSSDGATP